MVELVIFAQVRRSTKRGESLLLLSKSKVSTSWISLGLPSISPFVPSYFLLGLLLRVLLSFIIATDVGIRSGMKRSIFSPPHFQNYQKVIVYNR